MSYSNKTTGNITIIKPTSDFSLISNYAIYDKELSHIAFRILCYFASKPSYWDIKKEYALEEIKTSSDTYSKAMGELISKGYISEDKKSKGKAKGFDYFYTINTAIVDPKNPPLERIRDPKNSAIRDPKKPCVENIVISSNEHKKPSDNDSYTRQENLGSIYNTISSNTINNTKEKNYKKESEVKNDMDKKKQLVKRLNSLGIDNTDNLFKYNSLDEIEQHIKWLPYRISINTATEDQIKYKLIDSIRYKEGTPKELKDIELTDKLKLACRLIKTNGTSKGDMIQALIKKLVKMKELHSKKLDIHIKETIELETLQRNLLKQAPLTVKEKGEIQEKETELFEQHKQNISNELKILRDSLDIKELFKSSLDTLNSQEGLKILLDKEIALYGSLDSLFNRLEIFILKETYKECA